MTLSREFKSVPWIVIRGLLAARLVAASQVGFDVRARILKLESWEEERQADKKLAP